MKKNKMKKIFLLSVILLGLSISFAGANLCDKESDKGRKKEKAKTKKQVKDLTIYQYMDRAWFYGKSGDSVKMYQDFDRVVDLFEVQNKPLPVNFILTMAEFSNLEKAKRYLSLNIDISELFYDERPFIDLWHKGLRDEIEKLVAKSGRKDGVLYALILERKGDFKGAFEAIIEDVNLYDEEILRISKKLDDFGLGLLNQKIEVDDENVKCYWIRYLINSTLGSYSQAERDLSILKNISKHNSDYGYFLADIYVKLGRFEEAEKIIYTDHFDRQTATSVFISEEKDKSNLVAIAYYRGDLNLARHLLWQDYKSDECAYLYLSAEIECASKNYIEAVENYKKLLSKIESGGGNLMNISGDYVNLALGRIYREFSGRPFMAASAEASRCFSAVSGWDRLDIWEPLALYYCFDKYKAVDLIEKQIADLGRFGSVPVYLNGARLYSLLGNVERSAELLQRAIELGYRQPFLIEKDEELENLRKSPLYEKIKIELNEKEN